MRYRTLGKTGLQVSELGLGTCFMAGQGQDGVTACIQAAVDAGVNYFDTAADYGLGNDEVMLGIGLHGIRDRVVLATKVGYTPDPRGHRDADQLMAQFDASLQRLQTDYVDIIQVHEADFRKWWSDAPISATEAAYHGAPTTTMDDIDNDIAGAPVVEFLARAVASGKTRFIGLTAKNARLLARLLRALTVDSVMIAHQYNPIFRNADAFLYPLTAEQQVGVVIGAPLMKGWLAVPQITWRTDPPGWMDETFNQTYSRLLEIVQESGLPLVEVSLRWMLAESRLHSIVVGFSALSDVTQNLEIIARGPLPADLQAAVNAIGIVHPLIYQGRTTL